MSLHMQSHKSTQNNSIKGARNWKLIQNFNRNIPKTIKKIQYRIMTHIESVFIRHKHKNITRKILQTPCSKSLNYAKLSNQRTSLQIKVKASKRSVLNHYEATEP